MQFIIVVTSVAFIAIAIWLIGRRVRVTRLHKTKISDVDALLETNDLSAPHPISGQDYRDDVELGPIKEISTQSDADNHDGISSTYSDQLGTQSEEYEDQSDEYDVHSNQSDYVRDKNWYGETQNSEEEIQDDESYEDQEPHSLDGEQDAEQSDWQDADESDPEQTETDIPAETDTQDLVARLDVAGGIENDNSPKIIEPRIFPARLTSQSSPETSSKKTETDYVQSEIKMSIEFPNYRESSDIMVDAIAWLPQSSVDTKRAQIVSILNNIGTKTEHPHRVFGHSLDNGKWLDVVQDDSAVHYSEIVVALQLAYRGHVISERDWWKFTCIVEDLAKSLGRQIHWSLTTDEVFDESAYLVEAIEGLDIEAILILQLEEDVKLSEKSLNYFAKEFNLTKRENSSIYDHVETNSINDVSSVLFSVIPMQESNVELARKYDQFFNPRNVLLICNLPVVRNPRDTFSTMADLGLELADRLNGKLVDQEFNPVDANSISQILSYIDYYVNQLHDVDITPGSKVALQLFDNEDTDQEFAPDANIVSLKIES